MTHLEKLFDVSAEACYLGAFISPKLPENKQYFAAASELAAFNEQLGKKIASFMVYLSWDQDGHLSPFPMAWCENVVAAGAVPHITWEPWDFERFSSRFSLDKIALGKFDEYIRTFAQQVKQFGKPVFLRWAQEMNGFWYPWDGTHNMNDPQRYISAYRHVFDLFQQVGVTNVKWIWSPEVIGDLDNDNPIYDYHNYYPGDKYVDWIAMDGLNFGPTNDVTSDWRSFEDIFFETYQDLIVSYPGKPLMIGSMGSTEIGGSKAEWIIDAFEQIKKMPQLKLVTLFNIDKEANWTIDSSPESLQAYRQSISDPYFAVLES